MDLGEGTSVSAVNEIEGILRLDWRNSRGSAWS